MFPIKKWRKIMNLPKIKGLLLSNQYKILEKLSSMPRKIT
jgi:uncharacterized protein YfbU (UPF0304 family)